MNDNHQLRFTWECPNCGFINKAYAELQDTHGTMETRLIYCDVDEGGCDTKFAVEPRATVTATVYKLVKVEEDDPLSDYHANAIPGESYEEYIQRTTGEEPQ